MLKLVTRTVLSVDKGKGKDGYRVFLMYSSNNSYPRHEE
jgi:hypothetical protein